MNFKLDENLGPTILQLFLHKGHDCRTALEEHLGGSPDETVLAAAKREGRVLVTMDHDFGNVLRYPPEDTSGIAVLNPPGRASRKGLGMLVQGLLSAIEEKTIHGKLWIVEPARIREHETDLE